MANRLYTPFKTYAVQTALFGQTLRFLAIDSLQYSFDPTHDYVSSIPAGARLAISNPLTNVTFSDGRIHADPLAPAFVAPTGFTITALVLYASPSNMLLGYYDSLAGLPYVTTGASLNIAIPVGGLVLS